jgi:hypothetical protein
MYINFCHIIYTVLAERNIAAMPVIDDRGKVVGKYFFMCISFYKWMYKYVSMFLSM